MDDDGLELVDQGSWQSDDLPRFLALERMRRVISAQAQKEGWGPGDLVEVLVILQEWYGYGKPLPGTPQRLS